MENISFVFSATKLKIKTKGRMLDHKVAKIQIYAFKNQVHFGKNNLNSTDARLALEKSSPN